jgi:hypothetical protein
MACSFLRFKALRLSSLRTLQSTVCATEVGAVPDLQQRVQNGSETIRTSGFFKVVRHSLVRRTTFSVEAQGGHFEQFL